MPGAGCKSGRRALVASQLTALLSLCVLHCEARLPQICARFRCRGLFVLIRLGDRLIAYFNSFQEMSLSD